MEYRALLDKLIDTVINEGASDLHLAAGRKPSIRVASKLVPLVSQEELTPADTEKLVELVLPEHLITSFQSKHEADFSYSKGNARFRCNAYVQRGAVSMAMRYVPSNIRTLKDLNLPEVLSDFALREQGFFLVVGPVGHGKTTTLAAMVDIVNETRPVHIVTIEDPIEHVHGQKQAIIDQREVGIDTPNFATALRGIFRQDVDVALVGEMRGLETIATAVTAAETGHLVLSTLHTNDAPQTIDRIIDSFPANQQDQIRTQLASSLTGIFSQRLVPAISGGVVPVYELLVNTNAVSNLIREARTHEIPSVIETGSERGMISMNRTLVERVRAGEITIEDARAFSLTPDILERLLT